MMGSAQNTPTLQTERLLLRRFTGDDLDALFATYADREVNTFLPMFPLETKVQAREFLGEKYLQTYEQPVGHRYAVCLQSDNVPIGYVDVNHGDSSHDMGYGLRKEFWNRGIITEACRAVIAQLRKAGLDYVTATHDVGNPASGAVMKKIGMTYRYSYEELWQPKNVPVIFRMYQLNLDGREDRTYRKYWDMYPVHFVEDSV